MNDIVQSFLLNFNQLKIKVEHKLVSLYDQLIDYNDDDVVFPLLYNFFVHSIPISYSNETVLSFS